MDKDFFKNYRGRYSQFWSRHYQLIPNLPSSFDNANDIYELLAWLQGAFKYLLDDFVKLENEFHEFKDAITELLEYIIPSIIRDFSQSEEFKEIIDNLIQQWYDLHIQPIIDELRIKDALQDSVIESLNQLISDKYQELIVAMGGLQTSLNNKIEETENKLLELVNALTVKNQQLENIVNNLTTNNTQLSQALTKLITNLEQSGAWSGGLDGNIVGNNAIAYGTINLFSDTADGSFYIRTSKTAKENDLFGG